MVRQQKPPNLEIKEKAIYFINLYILKELMKLISSNAKNTFFSSMLEYGKTASWNNKCAAKCKFIRSTHSELSYGMQYFVFHFLSIINVLLLMYLVSMYINLQDE
jgi:hypothetical protein